jgi:flagellar biosynthesis GTPase FlhF
MERVFYSDEMTKNEKEMKATPSYRDRIYLKLKNDRTIKLYTQRNRPLLELAKKRVVKKSQRKLFETEEGSNEVQTKQTMSEESKESFEASDEEEGTWWWKDLAPLKQGHVKIELHDDADDSYYQHETYCEWGKLDPYCAKFKKGKILKYKRNDSGLPGKMEEVGSFMMKSSVHRPLISKEFLAFQ